MFTEMRKEYRNIYIFLFAFLLGTAAMAACGGFMLLAISLAILNGTIKLETKNPVDKFLSSPLACLLVSAAGFLCTSSGFSLLVASIVFILFLGYVTVHLVRPTGAEWVTAFFGTLGGLVAGGNLVGYAGIGEYNTHLMFFVLVHMALAFGLYKLITKQDGEGIVWLGGCVFVACITSAFL